MARPLNVSSSSLAALIRIIADKAPNTTLRELIAEPMLGGQVQALTIGELLGLGGAPAPQAVPKPQTAPQAPAGRPAAAASTAARRPSKSAEVSTAEGRAAYTSAVLAVIASPGGPWSAPDVRAKAGGTDLQFRAAVERLLADKQVKRTGKARGTRYTAV